MNKLSIFILLLSFIFVFGKTYSQVSLEVIPLQTSCPDSKDGQLKISVSSEEYPLILKVYRHWNGTLVKSIIVNSSEKHLVENLQPGSYWIKQITGNKVTDSVKVEITKPDPLTSSKIVVIELPSDENSCNGSIKAVPVGGTPPYTYKWITVENNQAVLTEVCWGIYQCMVNDANNCGPVKADLPLYNHLIDKLEYEKSK